MEITDPCVCACLCDFFFLFGLFRKFACMSRVCLSINSIHHLPTPLVPMDTEREVATHPEATEEAVAEEVTEAVAAATAVAVVVAMEVVVPMEEEEEEATEEAEEAEAEATDTTLLQRLEVPRLTQLSRPGAVAAV